ncbi:aminotransferase [Agromyces silvae]|uniref:aminotransferase n=1 Tax=Agromyces silvae TaxID=3388266 RepID=UPI00280B56ED|nr:aminotransferase [Agromyces protaetiae]
MASPLPSDTGVVQPTPPDLSAADAARIAAEAFGLAAEATTLGSHQDRNFLLTLTDGDEPVRDDDRAGRRCLLKVANPGTSAVELECQSAAADRIAQRAPGVRVPRSRPGATGATAMAIEHEGEQLHARVLDFLEGSTLSGSGHLSPSTVRAIGRLAATVDLALADFDLPGIERAHQWDLRRAPEVLDALLPYIGDPALRARVRDAADSAWAVVERLAPELPEQVIHGDLTDDNVVWSDPLTKRPDGVIDLGDLNRSWTVGELAITVSSLLHHDGVDLPAALRAVTAYHALRPLSSAEAAALWPLVVLRGAILVASGHHVVATDPENAYAAENLGHELAILDAAVSVPLPVASALVAAAIASASDASVADRLRLPAHGHLLDGVTTDHVTVLDLSATSPALHEGRWLEADIEGRIAAAALAHGTGDPIVTASATLTRFGEPRLTRSAPDFAGAGPDGTREANAARVNAAAPANTALGIELTFAEPVDLLAPWDGVVDETLDGLELRGDGLTLTLDGAELAVAPGAAVTRGERVGRVASAHGATTLGVRVERDGAGAPWFTQASLSRAWRAVVADPTPLVLGHELPDPRQDAAALVARRERALADVQEHYYDEPPMIVRGWQDLLIDADARVYLDSVNNVTSIGHAHPRLVDAVSEQWKLLNTNSRFNYPAVVDFAERLGALLPDGLDQVFLVNSGSEAVDLALRIARAASGRRDVLAVREAYHGWTDLSDAVSTSIADNPNALETRPGWVHTVDAPNSYRGRYRGADAARYAVDAVAEVDRLAADGTPVGAFIAETFYGNAGGIALPDGYLEAVYAAVRAHGGLAVADEVQVGYGRLGEWFWGFEQQGVVPDVVAVAKAVGNGQPLGAVITTREIAERFRSNGYFFSSAGGSPVSSVIGVTVLDVIRDERLQENARDTGAYFRSRLEELATRHPLIGAVHGSGFYLGVELVRDRVTLEPATEETAAICERMRELGVIIQPTSDRQCVLKVKPPLCFSRASADAFVDALDRVLETGW